MRRFSLLPWGVGEDAVSEDREGSEPVPPRPPLVDDVDDHPAPRCQVIRDDHPVASPAVLLGAHIGGSTGLREAEQLLHAPVELLGEGVIGVVPEATAPPGLVGRLLAEALPPVASEALPKPNISHPLLAEGLLEAVAVEVGTPLGGGFPPHVDEYLDAVLFEERQELVQGSC